MASGKTFRDPLTSGLRLVMLLPLLPVVVMVFVILAVEEGTKPWEYVLIVLIFGGIIASTLWMHAFLSLRDNAVRIGFMPFYWRTIPYRDIAAVDAVEVDPMRDYRGWGVKGRSTQPEGMLFSGGSRAGLRMTLHDDRRYVVTLPGPVDEIVAELRSRAPQLRSSHNHAAPSMISRQGM